MNRFRLSIRVLSALGCSAVVGAAVMLAYGVQTNPTYAAVTAKPKAVSKAGAKPGAASSPTRMANAAYVALEKNCGSWHGTGARMNRKVPTDRASHARLIEKNLVVPGKPNESDLYTVMFDKDNLMPPPKAKQKPSAQEKEAIRLWIAKGAPAPSKK